MLYDHFPPWSSVIMMLKTNILPSLVFKTWKQICSNTNSSSSNKTCKYAASTTNGQNLFFCNVSMQFRLQCALVMLHCKLKALDKTMVDFSRHVSVSVCLCEGFHSDCLWLKTLKLEKGMSRYPSVIDTYTESREPVPVYSIIVSNPDYTKLYTREIKWLRGGSFPKPS